jgi:hypothetical protein
MRCRRCLLGHSADSLVRQAQLFTQLRDLLRQRVLGRQALAHACLPPIRRMAGALRFGRVGSSTDLPHLIGEHP